METERKENKIEPSFGLNNKQKEAVLATEGPVLILAGAGAGKTKTITERIKNLIKNGVSPDSILAITFTNKAAKEMKERVETILKNDKEINLPVSIDSTPFVSTFHALGVFILKENASLLNIPRHFNIFDKNESKHAIKESMISLDINPKQHDPGKIQNIISKQKSNFIDISEYEKNHTKGFLSSVVLQIWKKYEETLRKEKAFDFDDLLFKTATLLSENEKVRTYYQEKWKYLHVDEYQDTNKVQYKITKLLTGKDHNICVVGDIDQNIYSWRGADIKNILDFEKDYPEAKIIILEENYRSTKIILEVANEIIKKNKIRREKNLFTNNEKGELLGLYEGYDEISEAEFVAKKAKELIKNNTKASEIAVLYRANFQSRILEEAFLRNDVPYQLLGTKFFERKEIKDVLSYIKASLNPESLSDLKRIINVPTRGIGKITILKMFSGLEKELPKTTIKKIDDFKSLLLKIKEVSLTKKPSETVKFVIEKTGLEDSLKNKGDEENERLENMYELVTLAKSYDNYEPEEGIEKLVSDSALASDQDEMIKEEDKVKLMTIHASKGLEFDYVFITGLEEDLFPHKKMSEEKINTDEGEEERRLFYVAITRARKKIFLSYTQVRTIYGSRKVNIPSEFILETDDRFLEKENYDDSDTSRKPLFSIDF